MENKFRIFYFPIYKIKYQSFTIMGNFQTINSEQQYDEGNNSELKISVDFKKPIVLELKPLMHWSLK